MRRTVVIIVVVGMLGLLNYGLRQRASSLAPLTATSTKSSSGGSLASAPAGGYKDGTYTGSAQYNPYGTVQIGAVISGGKITGINFIQMPQGAGHTNYVTSSVEPILKQETLQAQSASISFVSGATYTSQTYQASLQSALDQAAGGSSSGASRSGTQNTQPATPQYTPSPFQGGENSGYDN